MKIEKSEILEILKQNAISEDFAEQVLEQIGKGLGHSIVDIIKLIAEKSENTYDDMIVMAVQGKAKEMIDKLEIEL